MNDIFVASLKSFGEKTAGLFERKKNDAEQLAAEKAAEIQKLAEEQAQKAGEAIAKTRNDAGDLVNNTGELHIFLLIPISQIIANEAANY